MSYIRISALSVFVMCFSAVNVYAQPSQSLSQGDVQQQFIELQSQSLPQLGVNDALNDAALAEYEYRQQADDLKQIPDLTATQKAAKQQVVSEYQDEYNRLKAAKEAAGSTTLPQGGGLLGRQ